MSEEAEKEQDELEKLEAARAARKGIRAKKERARRLIDLMAIDELEIEHGDDRIKVLALPFRDENTPVLIAVRRPKDGEVKRYRARLKESKNPDHAKAAGELGRSILVHPAGDAGKALLESSVGLETQLGVAGLELLVAKAEEEGKD